MANSAASILIANNTPRILQAVQGTLTTPVTQASAVADTWYEITGLSVSITPTSANSNVLLLGNVVIGISLVGNREAYIKIQRDGVDLPLGSGTAALDNTTAYMVSGVTNTWSAVCTLPIMYMDSPATTSSVTYTVYMAVSSGSVTLQCNSAGADSNSASYTRYASTIIALEVN